MSSDDTHCSRHLQMCVCLNRWWEPDQSKRGIVLESSVMSCANLYGITESQQLCVCAAMYHNYQLDSQWYHLTPSKRNPVLHLPLFLPLPPRLSFPQRFQQCLFFLTLVSFSFQVNMRFVFLDFRVMSQLLAVPRSVAMAMLYGHANR